MNDPRIQKLPKWAQTYIAGLEQRAITAEQYAEALQVMIDGAPEIEPDVIPPDVSTPGNPILNGWFPYRPLSYGDKAPTVKKACTSSISHSIGQWDKTTSQRPKALYSSPTLALKSLLPKILKAHRDEVAATLKKIKEYEDE